jgi:uncharacterized protein (TIGR02118 family)
MASFIALYTKPEDVGGFEAHYRETHLPLVAAWPNVAEVRSTRMTGTPRGADPAFHLMAEIRFTSPEGMAEALQSEAMRAAGKDAIEMCRRFGCEATMLFGEDVS